MGAALLQRHTLGRTAVRPRIGLFGPLRDRQAALPIVVDDRVSNLEEQPIRDCVIDRARLSWRDPDVGPGPDETVQLGDCDPAFLTIEPELLSDSGWDFDRIAVALGPRVGDRGHQQLRPIASGNCRDDHNDRPILAPAFFAPRRLARPEIGIGKDVSGLWDL